jgi:hypothetical protein
MKANELMTDDEKREFKFLCAKIMGYEIAPLPHDQNILAVWDGERCLMSLLGYAPDSDMNQLARVFDKARENTNTGDLLGKLLVDIVNDRGIRQAMIKFIQDAGEQDEG